MHHPSARACRSIRRGRLPCRPGIACLLLFSLSGCASITNPVADAIPVRRIPPELLGRPREEEKTIPLTLLRQKPPDVYRLEPGDVLGVWIEGILGEKGQAPPVRTPEAGSNLPPALGFPIPVREDGTLPLPYINPVQVRGMSLAEVQEAIINAYTAKSQKLEFLKPGAERVLVSLMRPRQYQVLVVRQDSGGLVVGQAGVIGNTKRGTGASIELPAYENDVLNALSRTGGLPGLDAVNEVVIQRGAGGSGGSLGTLLSDPLALPCERTAGAQAGETIRIPLRLRPGEEPPFTPQDIVLRSGDIVFIEARDTELFYTGGLLPPRQFVLPRDYDLDVVQAVSLVSGPLVNGGVNQSNLSGSILQGGLGFPSPSLLTVIRKVPGGGQVAIRVDLNRALRDPRERILVQSGDFLILQETLGESIGRYVSAVLRFNFLGTIVRQRDLTGTTNLALP